MADVVDDDDDDARGPRRRRHAIAVPGWLLFACLFLPTLRVCGDPTMPIEFPPTYVGYLGGALLAGLALSSSVRARRVWFTVWFVCWYATAVAWLAMFVGGIGDEVAGVVIAFVGIVVMGVVIPGFHRRRFDDRAFWIGAIVQGVMSLGWCLLLATGPDAMWGAVVSVIVSAAFTIASISAFVHETRERDARRRATEPAPLPVARVVER